jgi:hypothetical protein
MQRKLIAGAVLALLLALTSVSFAFAGSDPKGDTNGAKVRVLHVTLKNSQETDLDLGASGPSVGDRFSVFGELFRNDKRVGVAGYECVTLLFRPGPDPADPPVAATDQCRSLSPSPVAPAPTAPPTASCRPRAPTNRAMSRSP